MGAPAIGHQPTSASPAAREKHMPAAHAQPQDCTGTGHCAGQGLHLVGSLGHHQQAQANQDPLYSVDLSATPQLHLPSTAEPAGEALHRSSGGEVHPKFGSVHTFRQQGLQGILHLQQCAKFAIFCMTAVGTLHLQNINFVRSIYSLQIRATLQLRGGLSSLHRTLSGLDCLQQHPRSSARVLDAAAAP